MERKAGWPMGLMGPKEDEKSHSSCGRTDGGWVDVCTVSEDAQSNLAFPKMESTDSRDIQNFLIVEFAF